MNSSSLAQVLESRVPAASLRFAALTDVGRVRERNEDSFLVSDLTPDASPLSCRIAVGEQGVLLAVADGMGGHADGDVASAMAVSELARAIRKANARPGAERVRRAVEEAHRAVCEAAAGRQGASRMGTTLTAVHLDGEHAHIAQVGDSRAYVVRAGKIAQLTKDQTITQMFIDAGLLDAEDRALSPYPNQLMQALGGGDFPIRVATSTLELREGDLFVLCSDGLTNLVEDAEIETAVREGGPFEETCQTLIDLANLRGGDDNCTVIIAGVRGRLPRATPGETVLATHRIERAFRAPGAIR